MQVPGLSAATIARWGPPSGAKTSPHARTVALRKSREAKQRHCGRTLEALLHACTPAVGWTCTSVCLCMCIGTSEPQTERLLPRARAQPRTAVRAAIESVLQEIMGNRCGALATAIRAATRTSAKRMAAAMAMALFGATRPTPGAQCRGAASDIARARAIALPDAADAGGTAASSRGPDLASGRLRAQRRAAPRDAGDEPPPRSALRRRPRTALEGQKARLPRQPSRCRRRGTASGEAGAASPALTAEGFLPEARPRPAPPAAMNCLEPARQKGGGGTPAVAARCCMPLPRGRPDPVRAVRREGSATPARAVLMCARRGRVVGICVGVPLRTLAATSPTWTAPTSQPAGLPPWQPS